MAARQPRRRRRSVPAAALPRPTAAAPTTDQTPAPAPATTSRRRTPAVPEHHITTDYSYVRKDLLVIAGVSVVSLGFVVAMSFVL